MKQYKKNLTLAILFIIKYLFALCLCSIMLQFIKNHNFSSGSSFISGIIYVLFYGLIDGFFAKISNNILTRKKNKQFDN